MTPLNFPRSTHTVNQNNRRTNARTAVAIVICALTALSVVELGSGTAGASESSDPVGLALAVDSRLDSLSEVNSLARDTQGDAGMRLGVVTDSNGAAPGGISATQIVVSSHDAAELERQVDGIPGVLSAEPARLARLTSDPLSSVQYGPVRIGVPALAANLDGHGTTVAVIDTGVMGSHPDLSPPLADGRARVLSGTTFLTGSGDTGKPGNVDVAGHGTHVAGIITAASNNGIGGAGVAPQAQILPIRVFNAGSAGAWTTDIAAAIRWAHDRGADVINMSLGAPGTTPPDIADAINFVTSHQLGGHAPSVVVASAGNSGTQYSSMWPAQHAKVIAVAATDDADKVASFSSRGSYVDVAAPGLGIVSTCVSGGQCSMSGTSMASPMVAAAAAILRSQQATRTPAQIQQMLESVAIDGGAVGKDVEYGSGVVRIDRATDSVTPVIAAPVAPIVPVLKAPSAPSAVTASCQATTCTVAFKNTSNGGSAVTGHLVSAVPDQWAAIGMAGAKSSPITVSGLTPNTNYRLTVISGNKVGLSGAATISVRTAVRPSPLRQAAIRSTTSSAAQRAALRRAAAASRARHAAAIRRLAHRR